MSEKKMVSRGVFVALGIICIILIAGLAGAFAYYVTGKNNTISSLNTQVSSKDSQISQLNAQIWDKNNTIFTLNSQIAQLNSSVTNLNNRIDSLNATIANLQNQLYALLNLTGANSVGLNLTEANFVDINQINANQSAWMNKMVVVEGNLSEDPLATIYDLTSGNVGIQVYWPAGVVLKGSVPAMVYGVFTGGEVENDPHNDPIWYLIDAETVALFQPLPES
jgi:prefoldin subunit 5